MILARRDGEWILAAFAPHLRRCNLSTPREPKRPELCLLWKETIYVQSRAPLDGLAFFPRLLFRGMRVFPEQWDTNKDILRLHVFLMYGQLSGQDGEQGTMARVAHLSKEGRSPEYGERRPTYPFVARAAVDASAPGVVVVEELQIVAKVHHAVAIQVRTRIEGVVQIEELQVITEVHHTISVQVGTAGVGGPE